MLRDFESFSSFVMNIIHYVIIIVANYRIIINTLNTSLCIMKLNTIAGPIDLKSEEEFKNPPTLRTSTHIK